MYRTTYESPLGPLILVGDDDYLHGAWFEGQNHIPAHSAAANATVAQGPVLEAAIAWLESYFAGHDPGPCPPVRAEGTAFQKEVWTHLTAIPYGHLTTYGQIAQRIAADRAAAGHPDTRVSARAVGAAVGRNPVSIIVPCHRVVAADGRLTGYSGGVERKAYLLALEGVRVTGGTPSAASRTFASS